MHHIKNSSGPFRLVALSQKLITYPSPNFATTVDNVDITNELFLQNQITQARNYFTTDFNLQYFITKEEIKEDISNKTINDIDALLRDCLAKNKHKQLTEIVKDCLDKGKLTSDNVIKELFRHYSVTGKVDTVELLRRYCLKVIPPLYNRHGEFLHYLAKAQCMKGNADSGLSILREAYQKHKNLRGFYRIIFRELIYDTVFNRSEATLVIFKKYVLEFSEKWSDHYPLVCFWHVCWSSNWFSDQMLSDELLKSSEALQDILKERCTAFSISKLKEYNEDAVVRLLQNLLKYNMMVEYAKVLQILFSYKLNIRDIKGCTEIIKNCETLGISLPSGQQGRYIKMLIHNYQPSEEPARAQSKDFKFKF